MATRFNLYDHQLLNQGQKLAREKRSKQTKRLFKFVVLALLVLVVLVAAARIPALINSFIKPFSNVRNNLVNYNSIDLSFRTNILLITYTGSDLQEISIGSLDPTDKKVQLLQLDEDQKIQVKEKEATLAQLFGSKERDSLYLEKLTAKITETLGLFIDGYILVEQEEDWQKKDRLENLANQIYSFGFFLNFFGNKAYLDKHLQTNLSVGELNSIVSKVKSLRPDRFSVINLSQGRNEQGYLAPSVLGGSLGTLLTDSKLTASELTVEVVNASGIEGVGSIFKNIFTNMGVNVVSVTTAETQENSELIRQQKTVLDDRLNELFKEDLRDRSDNSIAIDERVVIGKDLARYFDL